MNRAEQIAKAVIEAALPGAKMEFKGNQSHGEYDFDLRYRNGTVAVVEVTESANQNQKWMDAKFSKEGAGAPIEARYCKKSWIVFAMDPKTMPVIRKKADECLAKVERVGIGNFYYLDACTSRRQKVLAPPVPRCVEDFCCDLKIQFASVIAEETSPKIYIRSPVRSGSRGPNTPVKAGERESQKEDNRKKLGAAKTEERHLVVYIDVMNGLPWLSLTDCEPPSVLPKLPKEITHIWLIGHSGENKDEFIVWGASKKEAWHSQRVGTR